MFLECNNLKNIIFAFSTENRDFLGNLKGENESCLKNYNTFQFSEPLCTFLSDNSLHPWETIMISDSLGHLREALSCSVGTALYVTEALDDEEDYVSPGIDFILKEDEDFQLMLNGKLTNYAGEMASELLIKHKPGCRKKLKTGYQYYHSYVSSDVFPEEIEFYGRYFPKDDVRHYKSSYVARIICNKRRDNQTDFFAKLISMHLRSHKIDLKKSDNHILAYVPKKPSDEIDKFQLIYDKHAKNRNPLYCVKDYPSLKNYGPNERRLRVNGAFEVRSSVVGKKVTLIDDVYTTGATLAECTEVLKENGAAGVFPVVFAKTISEKKPTLLADEDILKCKVCKSEIGLHFNSRGVLFIGCKHWSEHEEKFAKYYNTFVEDLNRSVVIDDDFFDFEDIDL